MGVLRLARWTPATLVAAVALVLGTVTFRIGFLADRLEVFDVQKRCAVQAHVDERRLHAREHPGHLTNVYVPHGRTFSLALNV